MLDLNREHAAFDMVMELGCLLSSRPMSVFGPSVMVDLDITSGDLARLVYRLQKRGFAVETSLGDPDPAVPSKVINFGEQGVSLWSCRTTWPALREAAGAYWLSVYGEWMPAGDAIEPFEAQKTPGRGGRLGMGSKVEGKASRRGQDSGESSRDRQEVAA